MLGSPSISLFVHPTPPLLHPPHQAPHSKSVRTVVLCAAGICPGRTDFSISCGHVETRGPAQAGFVAIRPLGAGSAASRRRKEEMASGRRAPNPLPRLLAMHPAGCRSAIRRAHHPHALHSPSHPSPVIGFNFSSLVLNLVKSVLTLLISRTTIASDGDGRPHGGEQSRCLRSTTWMARARSAATP